MASVVLAPALEAQSAAPHAFGWHGTDFLLDGQPLQIRSGEMHYPRVPRAYWKDRMRKMRALGLNALCTYVFWNLHEPRPGEFDFTGDLDLAEYIRTAQAEGLWVLLRPGPFICSEWDFGGLPAWLLASSDLLVRSTDPRFLAAAERYLRRVGQEVSGLQVAKGGPILMVQVENEYGSYGNDKTYLRAIHDMIRAAGFDTQLYTSDGSSKLQLESGTLDDAVAVVNFGDGDDPRREFANLAAFRQNVPRMTGEYWVGWFDHWGEVHHRTPPEHAVKGLEWMLGQGISFSLYMVHGGSSFGYMSGANLGKVYEPIISAYDYDSPLDEAGRPTAKFHAIRAAIGKHLGRELPALPEPVPMMTVPRFELREAAPLASRLPRPFRSARPTTMEALGQSYGYVLYRRNVERAGKGTLVVEGVKDFAVAMQGSRRLGTLDRRRGESRLEVELTAGEPLEILVENMGRANFDHLLVTERKGIAGKVILAGGELLGWDCYPLPIDRPAEWTYTAGAKPSGPALYRGSFAAAQPADTFLDLRGWGKGGVWVNGRCLGRYWKIGPQQTLYLPAPWLHSGENQVIVLDLEEATGPRSLAGLKDPVYETPKG
jgi:beta-galactosidase